MSERPQFDIKQWGGYGRCYDALNELRPYRELQTEMLANLRSLPGQIILDAACGTGNLAWWAEKGGGFNGARLVGVDFADGMLEEAERKCVFSWASFKKVDLRGRLPFSAGSFHAIASANTLYAQPDPAHLLKEFFESLVPGGILVLVNPKPGHQNGLILKSHCGDNGPVDSWLNAHVSPEKEEQLIRRAMQDEEIIGKMLAVAAWNRRIAAATAFNFFAASELIMLVENCGFLVQSWKYVYADQGIMIVAKKGGKG